MAYELSQVVFTDKARCRDCYRCLRVCPVKAIELHDGQARVVPRRCIACGTCIRECPQHAKSYRNDLEKAVAIVRDNPVVAVSIAPSFAAVFDEWEVRRLPTALRKLGFAHVAETALGAYETAQATAEYVNASPEGVHVCTACPAVVNYVEQYRPERLDSLVPVVSPMIAHAQHIRAELGEGAKIIFIGPCVAKKAEAERPEFEGLIDCVITFGELKEWLRRDEVDMALLEESGFDEVPPPQALYFPVPGGLALTAGLGTDMLSRGVQASAGFDALDALLGFKPGRGRGAVYEPLFCPEGCIRGPGMPEEATNAFELRSALLKHADKASETHQESPAPLTDERLQELVTGFEVRLADTGPDFSEEQIRATLERTGRADPADQLNCGACGYPSCRENALAVLKGMAEPDMCIPHMRLLAERRTDRIIETSPNGIVTLDHELRIIAMNPSFRRMFVCSEAVLGKPISYLMDPEPFERVAAGSPTIDMIAKHPSYNLVCHQLIYALPEDRQYVGIFVNITSTADNEKKLAELKTHTQEQAQELMQHQVDMAQQMAKLLGETTARGEALVRSLLELAGAQDDDEGTDWRHTYTSK
jgi:iron only hydrogenase large subunit-like protein/uncharacterized Fe-S cluster-containing protein